MLDFIVRNARRAEAAAGPELVDIGFAAGRIAAIEPHIAAEAPSFDAEGCLCCAGLIETHIHLDKSRIIDRCAPEPTPQPTRPHAPRASREGKLHGRRHLQPRQGDARELPQARRDAHPHATSRSTHRVGVKGVEALQRLAKDYAWAVDLEICVFPQEGLTTAPSADASLIKGLEMGAKVIGAAPNYDVDHPGQINRIFELARRFDVDIDMHIDSGHDPASLDTHLVADLTERYKLGGRVAMGHVTKLAGLPPEEQKTHRPAPGRRRRRRHRAAGDGPLRAGAPPGPQRAALRRRRQSVCGAGLQLLDLDQQRAEPVHAASATAR